MKEANESRYWIRLLKETDYFEGKEADSLLIDIDEIIKILYSIIKSSEKN